MTTTGKCAEINAVFVKSEQEVSRRLIKKRTRPSNIYWGKIKDDGTFPLHSGTRMKGRRLGRVHADNRQGWHTASEGDYCQTKLCEQKVPEIIQHGSDDYYWGLAQKRIKTDWICLNELATRDIPMEEVKHFEEGLRSAVRYIWEEFYRSRYTDHCLQKFMGVTTNKEYTRECENNENIKTDAFIFERRPTEDGSLGEMDENYVRVNIDPAHIDRISLLTLDMLEIAAEELEYEDEAYFGDFGLLSVVTPHANVNRELARQENLDLGNAMSNTGYEVEKLRRELGTKMVFRNTMSLRNDPYAMRFYPDTAFNDTVSATYGAYNPLSPSTWPRFKRVFAYVKVKAARGVKYVRDARFRVAPFGITNILTPSVIESQAFPDIAGVSTARKRSNIGYAGDVKWVNPDWPCNEDREMGFWKMRLGAAIKPHKVELGYSYFHRIDQKKGLQSTECDFGEYGCDEEVSAYCYNGTAGDADDVPNENRPVAFHGGW